MAPRVYRGFDAMIALRQVSLLALGYSGAFLVLWTLGLVIRGWRGWALLVAPLLMMVGLRLFAWRRLSVELADGLLRYEGVAAEDDFEVPQASIRAVYTDPQLPGRPLVLVLQDGGERVLRGMRPRQARRLRAALEAGGAHRYRP